MQEMQTGTVAENGGRQAGASGASSNVSGLSSLNNPFATNVAPMLQKAAFSGKPAATHDITTNMNQSTGNFGTNKVTIGVHSLQKVGPRLRAEGNMIPPASDAATLRRQVAALQSDLEAHMESEQYLQSINQQLRERLELYMKQNHENVERAESELNTLHEDMEQTLELQQRLAQRASCLEKEKKDLEQALQNRLQEFEVERSSLQNQINNLSEDLKRRTDSQFRAKSLQAELECALIAKKKLEEELHGSCAEADALKLKTEEYCNELKELVAKEKRIELVDFCCRKSLLRRFFKRLKEAIKEQCLADVCEQAAASFSKRSSSKRGFQALRLATHRASQIRRAHNRHAKACLQDYFRAWWLATIAQQKYQGKLRHRKQTCLCSAVAKWKMVVERGKLTQDEEKYLTNAATKHWRLYLSRRGWKCWSKWIKFVARPLKMKLQEFEEYLNKLSCRQTLAAWKSVISLKRVKTLKLEQASVQERSWQKRRTFMRWCEYAQAKKCQGVLLDKGLQLRKLNRRREVIRCWTTHVKMKGHMRISKGLAFRHYFKTIQSKAFSQWRQSVTQHQAEARAVLEVNAALKRAAMVFWRDHHVLQAIKKKKEMKAIIHLKRRVQKAVRGLLACWWEEMASRRRANQLSQLLALRRRRSLLVTALHSWMHATFDNLLVANTKYHSELLDAKAQCDEQKLQTTAVDVENLKLIDQLHSLSSEVALLKTNINEKNSQEDELHRALEDGAVIEDSLRGELEQQNEWIKELELKVRELQAKLQTKNAEDTVEDVQHSLQLRSLEKALKELRSQYEQRCMQANSYEKALKETAEKLEGASDESQEKLSSAFEIAASLRKLLEDRESHFATLEGNCRRKELELGEIQRKLASANNTFCETVEVRDARINELENLLVHKQTEMLEAQQQLQDLQLALDAKENRVRKLEYGIKLKLERDSNRPRSYLSSWIPPAAHSEPRPLFQNNLHLAQAKETMRHLCSQTKTTLQDDMDYESNIAESRELNDWRLLMSHESKFSGEGASAEIRHNSTSDDDEEDMRPQTGVNISPSSSCSPRASTQLDQRSSSSKSPSTVAGAEGSPSGLNQEKLSVANLSRHNKYAGITQDKDPGAEDSLQCEIERLQARIMSRLRDSSPTDDCKTSKSMNFLVFGLFLFRVYAYFGSGAKCFNTDAHSLTKTNTFRYAFHMLIVLSCF
ncbi:hypothetical protein O6H91_03G104200 [Diphasiastrum complanatum]|uniref:Uncharacterized protein n=1 Tax=Diphasiastrum complanatum TaxID=34168 RepID=A0ACC2E9Y8_DIPCM|nr:hypothetical protein O6H91_03G104200 [Diphasiastrum complanatum]